MVKEFIPNGNILYFKNEVNIGMDGNYIEVLKHGKVVSKYSMLIGDDDIPQEDFFVKVPKILEEKLPDIVLNKLGNGVCAASYLEFKDNYLETDVQRAFSIFLDNGWIGAVINNELLDIEMASRYYG